jgi:hypothetical protein
MAFSDIQSYEDVYSWLGETLIPALPYYVIIQPTHIASRWKVYGLYVGQSRSAPSTVASKSPPRPTVAIFSPGQNCAGDPLVVGYPSCKDAENQATVSCNATKVTWKRGVDAELYNELSFESLLLDGLCNAASTPDENLTGTWGVGQCIPTPLNLNRAAHKLNMTPSALVSDRLWNVRVGCEGEGRQPPLFKSGDDDKSKSLCPVLEGEQSVTLRCTSQSQFRIYPSFPSRPAHTICFPLCTNTDYCRVARCTWIPTTRNGAHG